MQACLPQLLFRRCHLNCVDSETFAAESPTELACIKNCQDKVYQSFDLYMGITTRKAASASLYIDKSTFIGMEVEHSNDTSGSVSAEFQKAQPNEGIKAFQEGNLHFNRDVRLQAYKKN